MLNELRHLFERFNGGLFGRPDDAAPESECMPVTIARVLEPDSEAMLDRRIAALAEARREAGAPLVAGAIEVVGLDDVREALGERWSEVSAQVMAAAETEIAALIGPDDICRRYNGCGFLVCFARADVEEARERADTIAGVLRTALRARFPQIGRVLGIKPFVAGVDRARLPGRGGGLVDALCEALSLMREEAHQASRRYRVSLVNNFNLVFAPAIHARSRVTIFNRAILETTSGCTTLAQFQALADPDQFSTTLAELDYLVLTKSLSALHRVVRTRGGVIIIVPVNYRTLLGRESQDEYTRLLDMVPPAYKRLLGIEICGLPATPERDVLVGAVERLRPHVKWIAAEVASLEERGSLLDIEGIWALGYNLSGASSADPRLGLRLRQFVAAASASRLSTLAHGANSIGAALAACEAGFTCVDGPAIQTSSDTPKVATSSMPQFRQGNGFRPTRKW